MLVYRISDCLSCMNKLVSQSEPASTHWSEVILAGAADSAESRQALENLCRNYWFPLYAYARRTGVSEDDAKDLTQSFFLRFLERRYIRAADPQRGQFRRFLITSFRHFCINESRRGRTAKRGGGSGLLAWDEQECDLRSRGNDASALSPAECYDREWALVLMQRALQALKAEYEQPGREHWFGILKPFLHCPPREGDYEDAATRLQVRSGLIAVQVHRMRQRYAELVRHEVAETVGNQDSVEDELRHLVSVITR